MQTIVLLLEFESSIQSQVVCSIDFFYSSTHHFINSGQLICSQHDASTTMFYYWPGIDSVHYLVSKRVFLCLSFWHLSLPYAFLF